MARFTVVTTDYTSPDLHAYADELDQAGAVLVPAQCTTEAELIEAARQADGVIHEYCRLTRRVIERLERCRVIAHHGIGVDKIDVAAATEHGICVANVTDASLDETSDHLLGMILASARRFFPLDRAVRQGVWHYQSAGPLHQVRGQVLSFVGFGRIPRLVCRKAAPLGLRCLAYTRRPSDALAREFGVEFASLDTVLSAADILSVNLPFTPDTRHFIGAAELARLKPTAYVINISRGAVIDEGALIAALEAGRVAGAALDVFEREPLDPASPLVRSANVLLTPHCAWYSEEAKEDVERKTARQVVRVLQGGWPDPFVNPEVRERYLTRWVGRD
jgi:D-3-phosphoglycerate dehydrogenase